MAMDDLELDMLRDSLGRFLREQYSFSQRGQVIAGQSAGRWAEFAANGWLAAVFAEQHGGIGGGPQALAVLARELGRALVPEPVIENLLGGLVLERLDGAGHGEILAGLMDGSRRLVLAVTESADGTWQATDTRVTEDGSGLRLSGAKRVVIGGDQADLFLVLAGDQSGCQRLLLVEADRPGVIRHAYPLVDGGRACDLRFEQVALDAEALIGTAPDTASVLENIADLAAMAACWEAVGAMERVFAITLEYLKQRVQFGRPLAANQALQHRLVDMLVRLQESEALSRQALLACAADDPVQRGAAVSAAKVGVSQAARLIAQEAVQMHGGIGTTDEAAVSHYFKRLLSLEVLAGGVVNHQQRLAALLGGGQTGGLRLSAGEQAFCDELRDFIRANLDPATAARIASGQHPDKRDYLQWEQALAARGWLAYTWSREDGGPGWSVRQQFLFEFVLAEMDAPTIIPFGIKMVGPVLLKYGTEAQRRRHLPGILNSTVWWCQGYSEPGAGSDLAALSLRAERRGDRYVLNGQKIWTSTAHWADWMFALVRTQRESRPQDGISFLLIEMNSPGIEVRPIVALDGHHGFNEVFFKDVEVPAENLVGEEGKGWSCAKYLLSHERLEVVSLPQIHVSLKRLRSAVEQQDLRLRPDVWVRWLDIEVRTRAIEARVLDLLDQMMSGGAPGPEVSGLKIRGTELSQDILQLSMDLAGLDALPYDFGKASGASRPLYPHAITAQNTTGAHLYRRAWTILGGSTEIQKNIMAKTLLGL